MYLASTAPVPFLDPLPCVPEGGGGEGDLEGTRKLFLLCYVVASADLTAAVLPSLVVLGCSESVWLYAPPTPGFPH